MADRAALAAVVLLGARGCRSCCRPETTRRYAPALWDTIARSQSATLPAVRRRRRPETETETYGGEVSDPSCACPLRSCIPLTRPHSPRFSCSLSTCL